MLHLQREVKSQFSKSSLLIFKEIAPIFGTCGQFFGRPRLHYLWDRKRGCHSQDLNDPIFEGDMISTVNRKQ
jgi:hypothetical protein